MLKMCVRLSVACLFLAALPFGCSDNSNSSPQGSGGAGGGKTGGSGGGSSASGGSGGSSASGGSSGIGGKGGSGGSSGSGGDGTGGASTAGGAGGNAGNGGDATGGAGGMATGGGGGTSPRDGGKADTLDSASNDGPSDGSSGDDGGGLEAGGTCTDNAQNNDETDVDCGGGTCGKCGSGMKCTADGDCRTASCKAGKCADGFAPTATITQNGNMWRITLGTVLFEVDQSSAGKVYTFSIDGTDVVAKNIAATGSAFWTSPQTGWGLANGQTWPPPNEMDNSAYTPASKDNILTMTGPAWGGGLSITKRYWGNVDNKAITLEYTIKNGTSATVSKAPWEITRVYAGGLSFFPNAEPWIKQGDASFSIAPVTTSQGAVWFNDNAASYTTSVKGAADGLEGWAAHIACGAGLKRTCATGAASPILIKQWADTPASNVTANPTEREVEIYVDQSNTYEEFEQQGLYQPIPAGGTLVWTMHWLLRYLPSTVAPTPGSAALMTWVRGQLL